MSSLQKFGQKSDSSAPLDPHTTRLREVVGEATANQSVNFFGSQLRAVVLTGSVARDEASFVHTKDGWEVSSDAEFMIVLEKNAPMPPTAVLAAIRQCIESNLRQRNIQCTIDLTAVRPSYFRRLPPHIFSYELKHCGRVIWGANRVLELIPEYSPDELSREDAWRLLCNRMIEHLALVGDLPNTSTELGPRLHYATVKLYLDIATSYLVFAKAYEPTYRRRAERLRILAEQASMPDDTPFPLKDFSERVTWCTEWKLSGGEIPPDLRFEFWQDAIRFGHRLWRWEVMRMTKARGDLSTGALCDRLERQLKLTQKIRGWASVAKRSGGLKSWRHWPRWARWALRATPRYLVYRAGAELFFRLPGLVGEAENPSKSEAVSDVTSSLLPGAGTGTISRGGSWQATAAKVLGDYRRYIADTRA